MTSSNERTGTSKAPTAHLIDQKGCLHELLKTFSGFIDKDELCLPVSVALFVVHEDGDITDLLRTSTHQGSKFQDNLHTLTVNCSNDVLQVHKIMTQWQSIYTSSTASSGAPPVVAKQQRKLLALHLVLFSEAKGHISSATSLADCHAAASNNNISSSVTFSTTPPAVHMIAISGLDRDKHSILLQKDLHERPWSGPLSWFLDKSKISPDLIMPLRSQLSHPHIHNMSVRFHGMASTSTTRQGHPAVTGALKLDSVTDCSLVITIPGDHLTHGWSATSMNRSNDSVTETTHDSRHTQQGVKQQQYIVPSQPVSVAARDVASYSAAISRYTTNNNNNDDVAISPNAKDGHSTPHQGMRKSADVRADIVRALPTGDTQGLMCTVSSTNVGLQHATSESSTGSFREMQSMMRSLGSLRGNYDGGISSRQADFMGIIPSAAVAVAAAAVSGGPLNKRKPAATPVALTRSDPLKAAGNASTGQPQSGQPAPTRQQQQHGKAHVRSRFAQSLSVPDVVDIHGDDLHAAQHSIIACAARPVQSSPIDGLVDSELESLSIEASNMHIVQHMKTSSNPNHNPNPNPDESPGAAGDVEQAPRWQPIMVSVSNEIHPGNENPLYGTTSSSTVHFQPMSGLGSDVSFSNTLPNQLPMAIRHDQSDAVTPAKHHQNAPGPQTYVSQVSRKAKRRWWQRLFGSFLCCTGGTYVSKGRTAFDGNPEPEITVMEPYVPPYPQQQQYEQGAEKIEWDSSTSEIGVLHPNHRRATATQQRSSSNAKVQEVVEGHQASVFVHRRRRLEPVSEEHDAVCKVRVE